MKSSMIAALGVALVVASACVSNPETGASSGANSTAGVPDRGLPAQRLAYGSCGLFLWSLSGEPTFTFFSEATTGRALMLISDTQRELVQTGASGDIFGQFMTRQVYDSPQTGDRVDLELEPGEQLIDGQRVDAGRLRVTDAEGWSTVIPVSGVRACRERPDPSMGQTR